MVDHYLALLLTVFFEAGLLEALVAIVNEGPEPAVVRKTTLLLGEILKLASRLLPNTYSARMQLLPNLFNAAAKLNDVERFSASAAVYQIDSLNRTLQRSLLGNGVSSTRRSMDEQAGAQRVDQVRLAMNISIDDTHFRTLLIDSGVIITSLLSIFKTNRFR